jgi:hypothetical protein
MACAIVVRQAAYDNGAADAAGSSAVKGLQQTRALNLFKHTATDNYAGGLHVLTAVGMSAVT